MKTCRILMLGFISAVAACVASAQASVPPLAVIGDAGKWNANTESVQASIRRTGVSHLVLPGDNLYGFFNSYESAWSPWRDGGFLFDLVTIGNHNGGYAQEVAYFGMPGEYYSRNYDQTLRLIAMNSDNEDSGAEQAVWLQKELQGAVEPLVFVVFHHPSRSLSDYHPWTQKRGFHEAVLPILRNFRARITGLLVGHDHNAALVTLDDLPMLLTGAAMEPNPGAPVHRLEDGIQVDTRWLYDGTPTWLKLSVDPAPGFAQLDFIRARDDKTTCTARILTGQPAHLNANCGEL